MSISDFIVHFLLGFVTSFLGSIPLGAINAAVVRISMTQSMAAALWFIVGATIAELFYSFIAIHFSGFLLSFPLLEFYLQIFSIPVFIAIGCTYLFAKAKTVSEPTSAGTHNTFAQGLMIGFLNPLQIPFWLAYGTSFLSTGWIKDSTLFLNIFIAGIISGSFILLCLLAKFSAYYSSRLTVKDKTINRVIGFIFILLAIFQAFVIFLDCL